MAEDLDNPQHVSKIDSGNMLGDLDKFPDFLIDAGQIGNVKARRSRSPQNIVLVGMGGSASAADVLHDWLGPKMRIPIFVLRDWNLPKFIGQRTLLIAVSYSGETSETLSVFQKAVRRGCALAGIGSGGRLASYCKAAGSPFVQAPVGLLPRAALAPMVGAGAVLLESYGFATNVRSELRESARELMSLRRALRAETRMDRNFAKKIANKLAEKLPIIYALQRMSSVARRAKNQFAENSKVLAKYDLLPEAGHNDVVAWESHDPRAFPLIVRDPGEDEKEASLVGAFKDTLTRICHVNPLEIRTSAASSLGRILAPILLFDYVSVYLAVQLGVDPTPTRGIREYRRLLSSKDD